MTKKTKKQKEEIARRYKAGELIKVLAFDYDISQTSIRRIARECGIPTRYRMLAKHEILEIVNRLSTGESQFKIAQDYGCNQTTIAAIGIKNNLRRRETETKLPNDIRQHIINELKDRKSYIDIAMDWLIHYHTVYRIAKQEGLDFRQKFASNK